MMLGEKLLYELQAGEFSSVEAGRSLPWIGKRFKKQARLIFPNLILDKPAFTAVS